MQANKNTYRAILLLSFIGLNVLILFGISAIWSYLNSGADRSTMLHLTEADKTIALPKLVWKKATNEGRLMENQTLKEIERDYLKAWNIRNKAYATNDLSGVADYFTDSARVKLRTIIALNKVKRTTIHMRTTTHNPKINFYSEDGQMVVFTDQKVASSTDIYFEKKQLATVKDTTNYQIMMLLEDGFWRIRHLVVLPN